MPVSSSKTAKNTTASALARPTRRSKNSCSYTAYTNTVVERTGPPCVITRTTSNSWKLAIRLVVATNSVVGRNSGQVTLRKRALGDAPSSSAASKIELGTSCRPDRNKTSA